MKIIAIGLGQCGAGVADEFSQLNHRSKTKGGFEIIPGVFAVSPSTADLVKPVAIETDFKHRILVGTERLKGSGVEGDSELGATIMEEQADLVIEAVRTNPDFYQIDAILLIAGAAGGFGSGALPVLARHLKSRFQGKIIYALVILPFERESIDDTRAAENTANCLKSIEPIADAVFLVNNELYRSKSMEDDYMEINREIVKPFYNLLCAGAEKRKKHIGAKLLDAGDIIETLGGWTVLASSEVKIRSNLGDRIFHKESKQIEGEAGIRAMDEALGTAMSLCKPEDALSALYLIAAPSQDINVSVIKSLGTYLKQSAPNAILRSGDYPIGNQTMEVTIILSNLRDAEIVRRYHTPAN